MFLFIPLILVSGFFIDFAFGAVSLVLSVSHDLNHRPIDRDHSQLVRTSEDFEQIQKDAALEMEFDRTTDNCSKDCSSSFCAQLNCNSANFSLQINNSNEPEDTKLFNAKKRVYCLHYLLACGHSVCALCLIDSVQESNPSRGTIICSLCQHQTTLNQSNQARLQSIRLSFTSFASLHDFLLTTNLFAENHETSLSKPQQLPLDLLFLSRLFILGHVRLAKPIELVQIDESSEDLESILKRKFNICAVSSSSLGNRSERGQSPSLVNTSK